MLPAAVEPVRQFMENPDEPPSIYNVTDDRMFADELNASTPKLTSSRPDAPTVTVTVGVVPPPDSVAVELVDVVVPVVLFVTV